MVYSMIMTIKQNQRDLSKSNILGTKKRFSLERFYMYSKYREEDLKTHSV